jgi:D-sedoheptulose 7-phosphate isomerase
VANALETAEEVLGSRLRDYRGSLDLLAGHEALKAAAEAAELIWDVIRSGGKTSFFGNGGSSMDAGHLAAELLGRFYFERPAIAALSLADVTAAVTAIGNDYGHEYAFSRQLEGVGNVNDVAIGLSTSGNSPNVVNAFAVAREKGLRTVALTGSGGGRVAAMADVLVAVPSSNTPRVQEMCMHIGHSICEYVEARWLASAL